MPGPKGSPANSTRTCLRRTSPPSAQASSSSSWNPIPLAHPALRRRPVSSYRDRISDRRAGHWSGPSTVRPSARLRMSGKTHFRHPGFVRSLAPAGLAPTRRDP